MELIHILHCEMCRRSCVCLVGGGAVGGTQSTTTCSDDTTWRSRRQRRKSEHPRYSMTRCPHWK